MSNFCTLFDYNYIHFGLVMYDSLREKCSNFHLYIFAFDSKCHTELLKLELPHVTVISLKEFEDKELLAVKSTRSKVEYCWTCTPSIILYVLNNYEVDNCTYIDADLYFYRDPQVLIDEMGDSSILLTTHNFSTKNLDYTDAGTYCVQFMTFKKDSYALKALVWWRNACIEWCYARYEDGKYGDQKYLDDWLTRFEKVHILQNEGGGVAPWNVHKYKVSQKDGLLYINKTIGVVFYHFHNLKFEKHNQINLGFYELNKQEIKLIYIPYIKKLVEYKNKYSTHFNPNNLSFMDCLLVVKRIVKRRLDKSYNLYYIKEIVGN